jgi:rare lipoprotein A
MRRFGLRSAVALAVVGLTSSGPVAAVELTDMARLQDLSDTVQALDESIFVEAPDANSFEAIGGGEASYYGRELAGNRTASGERFNPNALTAAHRSLPLGTMLRVTNKANGRSVIVRINDRGPFARSRVIDVSLAAAREIAMVRSGKAQVTLEILRES